MTANPQLVKERNISLENVARINNLHRELETCLAESDDYLRETPREVMYTGLKALRWPYSSFGASLVTRYTIRGSIASQSVTGSLTTLVLHTDAQ